MSAPAMEGGQDDDDILGCPGDGFVDKSTRPSSSNKKYLFFFGEVGFGHVN
jgi:hypothetical protein